MEAIRKKLKERDKRFDEVDAKFERVFIKFIELENRIDDTEVSLRLEIQQTKNDILSAIDAYAKKSSVTDVEQIAMKATLGRHEKDIRKIKKRLKLAN